MSNKLVIMIPARSGSKRIPKKNTRLLSGKPLVKYAIETAKETKYPVYVNTDDTEVMEIAKEMEVNVYVRPKELASDTATNDDFMLDFLNNINCEYVLQILPTSPFITKNEINNFIENMYEVDTLVSVKDQQIGCVMNGQPLNFSKTKKNPPSQEMTPIKVYATTLMGWKSSTFKKNMKDIGCAYHGGNGVTDYYTLNGWSTVDIDHEEEFRLAETIAQFLPFEHLYKPFYHTKDTYTDYIVPKVLKDDGVEINVGGDENNPVINVHDLMENSPKDSSWYKTLINTENNSCTVVNQMPGEGNRLHYHAKWNEWWFILRGMWKFEIEGETYIVKPGDLVFINKGKKHKITAIGNTIASRLAVSRYDVEHIYFDGKK